MTAESAERVEECIKTGDLKTLKDILALATPQDVQHLESLFSGTDPVNLAIASAYEGIAIYLVEKGFSVDKLYPSPGKGPAEYDAGDNAAQRRMMRLKEVIDGVRAGTGRPSEGPSEGNIPTIMTPGSHRPQPPAEAKPQHTRLAPPKTTKAKPKSAAFEAVNLLQRYGNKFTTKDGCTLLHRSASSTPAHVYVLANNGVPVNVQNMAGDTALHLAVRGDNYDTTEALLQCCADLNIRNKMGQTPQDLANEEIYELLSKCEKGPVEMLLKGQEQKLARYLPKYWCNVDYSLVKDGLSLLQLAMMKVNDDNKLAGCCRTLQDFRDSSELIHCVLAENTTRLHEILTRSQKYSVNSRFKDRYGKTLLSHAIESNNLEIVKMLVNAGARVDNVRVRETGASPHTVPLFQKCLRKDLQPEIAHFIHSVQNPQEMMEKDHRGNTALLRAVEEGASDRLVDWMLAVDDGMSLTHRNESGMNTRELAVSKGRSDIVQIIDKFVLQQRDKYFMVKLPVHFYGLDNLQFTDESVGKTLLEVVEEGRNRDDIKALQHYSDIEYRGINLFEAAAKGDLPEVTKLNTGDFQDKNGYTALIRAIVFNQFEVAKYLCVSRPVLKSTPDNCNRYPLHYACALPDNQAVPFIKLLLERQPEDIEKKRDKDGIFPVEYKGLRSTNKITQILNEARTLDAQGREGSPIGPLPEGVMQLLV